MDVKFARLEQRVSQLELKAEEFHKILEPIKDETIRQDVHYEQITKTLEEIKADVKELKDRPITFLNYVLMAIISTIISFLFKHFGG